MLKTNSTAPRLGVNIDHIATLRQVRETVYPAPIESLPILKAAGASQVTLHLREDRRHIQDRDVAEILASRILPVNLELSISDVMLDLALACRPAMVTLVPEKRSELTTEGGLNCLGHKSRRKKLGRAVAKLKAKNIHVSLFLDPHVRQVQAAHDFGADAVEIHTGEYCEAFAKKRLADPSVREKLVDLQTACEFARLHKLKVYAGHGLNRFNLRPVVELGLIEEYNIGHAIVARAVFVGLKQAIMEIQKILRA